MPWPTGGRVLRTADGGAVDEGEEEEEEDDCDCEAFAAPVSVFVVCSGLLVLPGMAPGVHDFTWKTCSASRRRYTLNEPSMTESINIQPTSGGVAPL